MSEQDAVPIPEDLKGWQDISTAVLDEKPRMLAHFNGKEITQIDIGWYGFVEVSDFDGASIYDWVSHYGIEEPTHWAPVLSEWQERIARAEARVTEAEKAFTNVLTGVPPDVHKTVELRANVLAHANILQVEVTALKAERARAEAENTRLRERIIELENILTAISMFAGGETELFEHEINAINKLCAQAFGKKVNNDLANKMLDALSSIAREALAQPSPQTEDSKKKNSQPQKF